MATVDYRYNLSLLLATFAALAFPAMGFAQTEQQGESRIEKVEDRWEDKIVLEITHDTWLNAPPGVDFRLPSQGFKAYFFSDYTFGQSDLSFAWGFGIASENVHSNAGFLQEVSEDGSVGPQILTPFPEGYEWERNKFVSTHLELPVEFRYIQTGKRPFKLAVGMRFGYLLSTHQKVIDTEGKRKVYDFESMNAFRYGLSARIGIGKVQATGFYSLVPLVESGAGSEVVPISVGLAFTFIK